jgi:hypothetical protein
VGGEYGVTLCTHVCKWKMRPANTGPGMGKGVKESGGGVNSTMIYLIYFKNFCKAQQLKNTTNIQGNKILHIQLFNSTACVHVTICGLVCFILHWGRKTP